MRTTSKRVPRPYYTGVSVGTATVVGKQFIIVDCYSIIASPISDTKIVPSITGTGKQENKAKKFDSMYKFIHIKKWNFYPKVRILQK